MLIAFVHTGKAFLPGMAAYSDYFSKLGIDTTIVLKNNLEEIKPDVEWHFMGVHSRKAKHSKVIIHEYASASTPPLGNIKNATKKLVNIKPDFRIFLNEYVKGKFGFTDSVPFGYRDLGVHDEFLNAPVRFEGATKKYDFIYVGSTAYDAHFQKMLDHLSENFKERSVLILSKNYEKLAKQYERKKNIEFSGPVPQSMIPFYISSARFAINIRADAEPYNRQTSTKLLEYAACKIPVITSDLQWVRQFQKEYGGKYFYLNDDLTNFTWDNINRFEYSFPDLSEFTWEQQIKRSGVLDFLSSKFPTTKWS